MPDTVALSENIFDVALWVKNPRWPPIDQGQTKVNGMEDEVQINRQNLCMYTGLYGRAWTIQRGDRLYTSESDV